MKFLIDENIAKSVAKSLHDIGHDTLSVYDWKPGASDREIMQKAEEEDRIIITHDKDFAHLFFAAKSKPSVILLRTATFYPETVKQRLKEALGQLLTKDLKRKLVTVSEEEITIRK